MGLEGRQKKRRLCRPVWRFRLLGRVVAPPTSVKRDTGDLSEDVSALWQWGPRKATRLCGERRSSAMTQSRRKRQDEGYGACDDEDPGVENRAG